MRRQMKPRSHRLSHVRSHDLTADFEDSFSYVSFTMSPEKGLDLPHSSSKMGEIRETNLEYYAYFLPKGIFASVCVTFTDSSLPDDYNCKAEFKYIHINL